MRFFVIDISLRSSSLDLVGVVVNLECVKFKVVRCFLNYIIDLVLLVVVVFCNWYFFVYVILCILDNVIFSLLIFFRVRKREREK